jgi:hypothetical protein
MTQTGELVLVYMEGNPAFFARIEDIISDSKPEWFHVKMLVLQVPLMVITWILREPYINGDEFTMGGRPVQLVKVVAPEEEETEAPPESKKEPEIKPVPEKAKGGSEESRERKVVSLMDRKKKNQPT